MGENCCICFPIDCGVKTYAVIMMIGAIGTGGLCLYDSNFAETFWVAATLLTLMSIVWLYTFCSPSEDSRKSAFLAFVVIALIVGPLYTAYQLYTKEIYDYACSDENIAHYNEQVAAGEAITTDQCIEANQKLYIADAVFKFLFNLYFCTVLRRWSQDGDSYDKM